MFKVNKHSPILERKKTKDSSKMKQNFTKRWLVDWLEQEALDTEKKNNQFLELIKKTSMDFNLPRKVVFEIHSKYLSLLLLKED